MPMMTAATIAPGATDNPGMSSPNSPEINASSPFASTSPSRRPAIVETMPSASASPITTRRTCFRVEPRARRVPYMRVRSITAIDSVR
jgi:hypothetical protein